MSDIRYVCLSDMHLGEEDSLLTKLTDPETAGSVIDTTAPSQVMVNLVECLRDIISGNEGEELPTLILNGDILELALAKTNEAAMVFQRFMKLVMAPDEKLFGRVVYIPGNHDHHLWELARETQYIDYISTLASNAPLPIPFHTTSLFEGVHREPVKSDFLAALIKGLPNLEEFPITIAYPNFGVTSPDERKCVIFHHGHFIEPLYKLVSKVKSMVFLDREEPRHVWDLEAENFAWIDFFWSAMGRSGQAGEDIELIYEKMHDEEALKELLGNLAASIAEEYDLPYIPGDRAERNLLDWGFRTLLKRFGGMERKHTKYPLSDDAQEGFENYMNGQVREQIDIEGKGDNLAEATIVLGHTHKPYEGDEKFTRYPGWVNVYNTGGWVVESVEPEPRHGASIVLVDDDLDAVSIRVYNEGSGSVAVKEAKKDRERDNPLHNRISEKVRASQSLWDRLSAEIARSLIVRARSLHHRIKEDD